MKLPLAVTLIALAACSSGDDSSSSTPSAPAAATDQTVSACASLDGQPTIDVANRFDGGEPCGVDRGLDELETSFLGVADRECVDGTVLYWNDAGWGRSDGSWVASDEGLPPDEELQDCSPD